jgi:hypothetical protein
MNRNQWIALAALVLVGLLILWLGTRNRQPPMLPADADHVDVAQPEGCNACHGPGEIYPRDQNHPLGDDCTRCHGRP